MAGGKETPRQKMIGLMYLVLTAMLALNVSKAILKGYLSINDSIEASKKSMAENNNRVTEAFKNSINGNPAAAPYFTEATNAQKDIMEVFKYIDDVKGNMVRYVLDLPESTKVLGDTINLRHNPQNDKIDDYDKPTTVLLGTDDMHPLETPLSAGDLKKKLEGLHKKLTEQLDRMQKTENTHFLPEDYANLKKKIDILKPVASGFVEDGLTFTWEMDQVDHLPMAAVFVNLNKMQADLRNVEAEILQVFSAASGKLVIKFDQLQARVIAKSSYVQAGTPYEADVFIGASSSKISSGDMEIIMGVDSIDATKGAKGTFPVEIVRGEGKLKINTSAEGDQKYKGVIKYKEPTGGFKYYPFSQEFKVAKPAGSVSADMMNVFYAGVPNPVTASAAGISPLDVDIAPSGCGVRSTKKGPGKYELFFTGTGECMITVKGKDAKGQMQNQGPPLKFRVKPLPKPEIRVAGKFSPPDLKKGEASMVASIAAGAPGFDLAVAYVVKSYELLGKVKGKNVPVEGVGSNLSAEAMNLFKNADVGSKIFIDLKVVGPDGKQHSPACSIRITR